MGINRRGFLKALLGAAAAAATPALASTVIDEIILKSETVPIINPTISHLEVGQWYNIAIVKESDKITTYLNGKTVDDIDNFNLAINSTGESISVKAADREAVKLDINKQDHCALTTKSVDIHKRDRSNVDVNKDFTVTLWVKIPEQKSTTTLLT